MKPDKMTLEQQLSAIPLRNKRVKTIAGAPGQVPLLEVEMQYAGLLVPVSHLLRMRRSRRIQLDPVGWAVYEKIDGQKTFERMIDDFAAEHNLAFLESRALLMAHIRNLMKAGLVVVGIKDGVK